MHRLGKPTPIRQQVRLIAFQRTPGSNNPRRAYLGPGGTHFAPPEQLRPIHPVTLQQLNVGSSVFGMLRIQHRCGKWGVTVGLPALPQQSAHRKIPTKNVHPSLAHIKSLSKLLDRPAPRSHCGKETQLRRGDNHTRQSAGSQEAMKGFNTGDGRAHHEVTRLNYLVLWLNLE